MKKAILFRGTSFSGSNTYRDTNGNTGEMVNMLQVYQRDGKPCKVCKTKIVKESINGRSSFYCPKCQKLALK
jgi:formamidopyrimidine-DNA glycosylase